MTTLSMNSLWGEPSVAGTEFMIGKGAVKDFHYGS